jgi:hypothetical protein
MPEAQSNIGTEQRLDVCSPEKRNSAGRWTLSCIAYRPSTEVLIGPCEAHPVRDESSCVGTRKGTSVFTAL